MKMCHVAYGSGTFDNREKLKRKGFLWHPGDKIWIKFWDEDEQKVETINHFVESLPKVYLHNTMADQWIRTCVDPVNKVRGNTKPTGYRPPPSEEQKNTTFTYKAGDQLEIRAWLAKKVAEELGQDLAFRNIEITEPVAESAKAIYVKFKYISEIAENCHLCGRSLDIEISRACGIGPVCAKRLGFKRAKLEDAQEILKKLNQLVQLIGEVGPIWIPKSQIQKKLDLGEKNEAVNQN